MDETTDPAGRMDITLAPMPDKPNKWILVSGEIWGATWCTHHGMHGNSYTIGQVNNAGTRMHEITIADPKAYRGFRTPGVHSFNSRKDYKNKGDKRPTEQRIIDLARELIRGGHLISPSEYRRRYIESLERASKADKQIAAEKKEKFRQKVIEALDAGNPHQGIFSENEIAFDRAVDRLVEAMEWAQSQ